MAPKFYGKIKAGSWTMDRWDIFHAYAKGLPDGDYYTEIHRAKGPSKTLQQLGYYYAVIVPTAYTAMKELGHDEYTVFIAGRTKVLPLCTEVVDYILKDACAWEEKSKAKMSMEECSNFIDRCIRWCARYLSCVIPPPPEKNERR